jgi:predicted nuclease with TOPRIM domain
MEETMGALDYLKEFEGRVLDAKSYQLLRRNYELQEENNGLLNDKIKHLENEVSTLRQRNEQLIVENKNLMKKVSGFEEKEKYKNHEGISFKINQDGTVEPLPLCPNCRLAISDTGVGIYKCSKCGYVARPNKVAHVLVSELTNTLNKEL